MTNEPAEPVATDPDWSLLARAGRGDDEAFAALVRAYEQRLVRLCERLLGQPEEARDAAQEVFLKAYRHAGRAEPRGQLFTWLYRIAVNYCLNRLRRRKIVRFFSFAELAPVAEPDAELDPIDDAPDPERTALAAERWRRTRAAIDRLPENQRAVLVLAKFEGMSYQAIAATLGITEGAVESRLVRAMRRLQAQDAARPQVPPREETRR